jgi:hypothetical protein
MARQQKQTAALRQGIMVVAAAPGLVQLALKGMLAAAVQLAGLDLAVGMEMWYC